MDNARKELAKETSEKERIAKSQKENNLSTKKEYEELKIKLKTAETSLTSSQTELTGANKRMENLTKMLRKYKQIVSDLKTENQKAIDNELETKKELAKEKLNVKKLTEQQEIQAKNAENKNKTQGSEEKESEAQVSSSKTDKDESTKTSSAKIATNDESHGAKPDVSVENKALDEINTEKVDVPVVPKGGFNFAPSKPSKVSLNPISESKMSNSLAVENPPVQSRNTSSASLAGASEEKQDTPPSENSTSVTKTTDQSTKEENLRAKLMKRKRELEAELKKKTEDEKANSEPLVKRLDTGDKIVEKDVQHSSHEIASSSDVKNTASDDKQNIETKTPSIEKRKIDLEKKAVDPPSGVKDQKSMKEDNDSTTNSQPIIAAGTTASISTGPVINSNTTKSETFLNLQPPGKGNTPMFVFGKSSNIQLPIPTAKSSPGPPAMGVFGKNPFTSQAASNDKNEISKKRPLLAEEEDHQSKLLRTDEMNLKDTAQPVNTENDTAEEGEVKD